MTGLATDGCDQFQDKGFRGFARAADVARRHRIEADDPYIHVGGTQRADRIGCSLGTVSMNHQPNGRGGRDDGRGHSEMATPSDNALVPSTSNRRAANCRSAPTVIAADNMGAATTTPPTHGARTPKVVTTTVGISER